MSDSVFSPELEAQLSGLVTGEVALDSPEGQRLLSLTHLSAAQLQELCSIHDALEFHAVVRESRKVADAPGSDAVDRILQEAARAGIPEASNGLRAVPAAGGAGANWRSRAWVVGGLLAAAAVAFMILPGRADRGASDLTSKALGGGTQSAHEWLIVDRTLQIPHELKAGQVVDVVIEQWTELGAWERLVDGSSRAGTLELSAVEREALDGAEEVRLRAWMVSADGSRSSLYSGAVTLK